MSKFFLFDQNNSGGSFERDDDVAEYVFIQADDYRQANRKAKDIGIYFDGCSKGMDCSCCGDRWYELWNEEGNDVPTLYGEPLTEYKNTWWQKEYRIHYQDGRVERGILEVVKN